MTTNKPKQPIILASASPRRHEILRDLGLKFSVDPCPVPEPDPSPGELPKAFAVRAARFKVRQICEKHPCAIVIGADTVVVLDAHILGKPAGREEARTMLRLLSGRWHEVVTGLCLRDSASGKMKSSHTASRVHFRRLSSREIDWYLSTGEYRDKAGAYAIQGYGSLFVDRIEGCYFNVVGFPVSDFAGLCRRLGVALWY